MGVRYSSVAVVVAIAFLAGCGGEKAAKGSDLTTIRCPAEHAANSFDTAELIGNKLDDARQTAAGHGCDVVVAMKDGEGVPVPIDVDPKRIYVYTENGVVT